MYNYGITAREVNGKEREDLVPEWHDYISMTCIDTLEPRHIQKSIYCQPCCGFRVQQAIAHDGFVHVHPFKRVHAADPPCRLP